MARKQPKLARLELEVLEALWALGKGPIREAQLAEAGKLTRDDVRELEKTIKRIEEPQKAERKPK